jgi:hypothetical protein
MTSCSMSTAGSDRYKIRLMLLHKSRPHKEDKLPSRCVWVKNSDCLGLWWNACDVEVGGLSNELRERVSYFFPDFDHPL